MNAPHPIRAQFGQLAQAPIDHRPVLATIRSSAVATVATATKVDLRTAILTEAWEAVNAIGGYHDPVDLRAAGRGEGLDKALAAIERLMGGPPETFSVQRIVRGLAIDLGAVIRLVETGESLLAVEQLVELRSLAQLASTDAQAPGGGAL